MRIIQTLYIDSSKDPLKDSFGWARPEYHLMSWALSPATKIWTTKMPDAYNIDDLQYFLLQ